MRTAKRASLLAISLLMTVLPMQRVLASDSPPRKIVSGWAPYWATNASTSTITANADLMGDVSPFWFSVSSISRILDQYTSSNSIPMATQVATLHSSGVKVIPTFTDGTGRLVLAGILADPIKSAALISTLTTMTTVNNFDGIDLDWEGFAFTDGSASWPTTQPNWTRFIGQLAASLHQLGKVLSVTTPEIRDPATGKRGYWVYDWAGIASSIDRLRIMTYDYSVSSAGPIGPITWVETTAKYAASIVPASKIWVGVPAYGRDWVVAVTGTCPVLGADGQPLGIDIRAPGNGVAGSRATFTSRDAQKLAATYGVTPTWNATYGENTFNYSKTYVGTDASGVPASCTAQRTAWYQDPRGVQARAALVGKYRLGGIAFWTFGIEDPGTWAQLRNYAKTISPDQVIATLTLSKSQIGFSTPSVLSATFKILDSTPVIGVPILFQTLQAGATSWRDIGTATTTADGVAQLALIGSQNLQVRALSQGTWQQLAATSAPQYLNVGRLVSAESSTSVRRTAPFFVTGSLWPGDAGVILLLQTKSLGQWVTIANSSSTAGGSYSLTATSQNPGLFAYRVVVNADTRFNQVFSAPFTILIR